jgi:hypothetical protein
MSGNTWKPLKGTNSNRQFTWVTAAPVRQIVNSEELRQIARAMKQSIAAYDKGGYSTSDGDGNFLQDVDDWNDRVEDAQIILGLIIQSGCSDCNIVYDVLGVTVGIICVMNSDPAEVDWLVSHPGVDGSGGTLIELACDWSESNGHGGRLTLSSFGKKSTAAYRSLGFTKDDGDYESAGKMTLNPVGNPVWTHTGQNWKLAKHVAKGYYSTRTKPLPVPRGVGQL